MKRRFVIRKSSGYFMGMRILSFLLTLSVCFSMLPAKALTAEADNDEQVMPLAAYSGGSGTASDPYLICSGDDLKALADAVNSGEDQAGVYFEMMNDIDLGGESDPWPTIGITIDNAAHQFRGVFNGGQFTITGLYVNRDDDDAGLFGYVGQGGVIRYVNVYEPDVSGTYWCGVIASRNYGLIEYCSTTGGSLYSSQQFAGGIVGDNHGGIIRYCYNRDTVIDCEQIGGGIAGRNSGGTVENCYNTGDVYTRNIVRSYAGGVVGENTANSTIDNCYSTGWVDGSMASGAIAGANGEGSSVTNCYYPDSFEEGDLPGLGGSTGNVENVTPKSEEDFESGEVAWELSKGNNGEGWGQTLDRGEEEHDKHPHFTEVADKPYETTPVYRVTFKSNNPKIDLKYYVDPDTDVELPDLSENPNSKWYVDGFEFDGKKINEDKDAIAGMRILFSGETDTITVSGTYSTNAQVLELDLDAYMEYEENMVSSDDRFEYKIINDIDDLNAELNINGSSITIPEGTNVKDGGYTLKINAHEKKPYIAPLSMGGSGTGDVTLTVNIMIEKATPVISIKPEASEVNYGKALADSSLTGGEAQHPFTEANVKGTFAWENPGTEPTVTEAASVGYSVTFTPEDTTNYNNATTLVTLTVNKIDSTVVTKPKAIDRTYDGTIQDLIIGGSAEGGTMKYWLGDDAEYSSTIPSRANAGEYTVWYKVVGDENHNDTEPEFITVTISPYPVDIAPDPVIYNGSTAFVLTLDGVMLADGSTETVVAALKPYSKNVGSYTYASEAEDGKYTAELSNSNYVVGQAGTLTIGPLAAMLQWGAPLTFVHDGFSHTVAATVSNVIEGDKVSLKFRENEKTEVGDYIAEVTDLDNSNYTLDGAQNTTQPWHITLEDRNVSLEEVEPIVYGDYVTLTVKIENNDVNSISTLTLENDMVEFYINDNFIKRERVTYNSAANESGSASITVKATSGNYFSAGANVVKALYGGSMNVQSEDAYTTVMVIAKPIAAEIIGDDAARTKTYDGNDIAAGLGIELDGVEECDKNDVDVTADTYTYNSSNVTEAATITANNITLSGTQSGNYTLDGPVTTSGEIKPKTVGLEWRGSTGLVYTGNSVNVNATAIALIPGDECTVEVTNGTQFNAGTYIAEAISLSNTNYVLPTDIDMIQKEYTIEPAALYIPEKVVTYDGTREFYAELQGATLADDVIEKVKVIASSADVGDYAYAAEDPGNTEDKFYTASDDSTNYKIAGGAILTIQKADPIYTPPTAKNLTYNGTEQKLVNKGSAKGGTMEYSLSEDGPYSEEIPTGIKAGTYTVWYRVTGDNNHNDIAPQSLKVTIKADSGNSTDPNAPTDPSYPTGPNNPNGSGRPNGSGNSTDTGNNSDGTDGNDGAEDISSSAAEYAANEKIGIAGASESYTGIVMIIPVIAALTFILKKKYFGQKDRD